MCRENSQIASPSVRPTARNQDRQPTDNLGATGSLRKVFLAPSFLLTHLDAPISLTGFHWFRPCR
ncbi:MAG: hypothetical protein DWH84_00965 [Planctomycetota bacterium]|nr:MAG: hypothetical protein DWH84_00965 [Planctomycetota bacterium]